MNCYLTRSTHAENVLNSLSLKIARVVLPGQLLEFQILRKCLDRILLHTTNLVDDDWSKLVTVQGLVHSLNGWCTVHVSADIDGFDVFHCRVLCGRSVAGILCTSANHFNGIIEDL